MTKRIIISVGGTGGHIYPALALAKELRRAEPGVQLLFVGGNLDKNKYFDRQENPFESVSCGPVLSKNPFKLFSSLTRILRGIWQSSRIFKNFKPDIVVGFGSYYTFPVLLAAKWHKVPIILHEANSIPGKVNKLLARYAAYVGTHFPSTKSFLKGNVVEVGMPLREGYFKGSVPRKTALEYFCLSPEKMTIMIFGGSQGAKAINEMTAASLTKHYRGDVAGIQVLHFTGDKKLSERLQEEYVGAGIQACVKEFEARMDLSWQAADLVISRSGAGTIAEQMEFEVPGILIPYPHASDAHQDKNADFMVRQVGGAVCFHEHELSPITLNDKLQKMMDHDKILLRTMRHAMRDYKHKMRKMGLCSLVLHAVESQKENV